MNANIPVHVRLSQSQQQELNELHNIHKMVTGDDTLTQSHTIRGILSMTVKYLNNPDPDKKTPLDVWADFLRNEELPEQE